MSLTGVDVNRPLPVDIGPLTVDMVWLARRDADPTHQWLREQLQQVAHQAFTPETRS